MNKRNKNAPPDEFFMRKALEEARRAEDRGEVPVGAVVVADGKIISRGHNEPIRRNDPTAHAEIVALRKACRRRKNYRLVDCDLYVTLEPCAMCLGAAVQARIRRLVYGAPDPKAGTVGSVMRFPFEKTNHKVQVGSGVLGAECSELIKRFFRKKRKSRDA